MPSRRPKRPRWSDLNLLPFRLELPVMVVQPPYSCGIGHKERAGPKCHPVRRIELRDESGPGLGSTVTIGVAKDGHLARPCNEDVPVRGDLEPARIIEILGKNIRREPRRDSDGIALRTGFVFGRIR